jgi:hypothetical protein
MQQLMFKTTLEHGLPAASCHRTWVRSHCGRDGQSARSPEHVVAIFRSLTGQGELTLSDGR